MGSIVRRVPRGTHFLAIALLATLAAALVWSGRAAAVDATKPAPCAGVLIPDVAGDAAFDPSGLGLFADPATPNADIRGLFFNYRPGATGAPVLTANIQIANLSKELPSFIDSTGGLYYYVFFTVGDRVNFVKAVNADGESIQFQYGALEDVGGGFLVYNTEGDTNGRFFEGPDGVVQLDVPAELGGRPGTVLHATKATVDTITGFDDFFGLNSHADTAPQAPEDKDVSDPTVGVDYTVAACPAPRAARRVSGTLPVHVPSVLGSARRANRTGKLTFRVTADRPVSRLKAKLRSGRRVVATGSLSRVNGAGKLRLKATRKLKSGSYTLSLTGTADGRAQSAVERVRLKR